MEAKLRINRAWLWKTLISLAFGLFMATAQAQILGLNPPIITVQPVGTNVQNGDTITLNVSAYCTLGSISNVTWYYSNSKDGSLPSNATVSITGLGSMNVSSTLTLSHVNSASAGAYYVKIENELLGSLLGGVLGLTTATVTSQNATVGVVIPVIGNPGNSGMVAKGFKVQFTGPTGSNLVIQATSDMKNWISVYTNVLTGGSLTYTDAVARTVSGRFYRAKLK